MSHEDNYGPQDEKPESQTQTQPEVAESVTLKPEFELSEKELPVEETLSLLDRNAKAVESTLAENKVTRLNIHGNADELERWQTGLQNAFRHHPQHNSGIDSLNLEDAILTQTVEYEGSKLGPGRVNHGAKSGRITGEVALLRARAAARMGTEFILPLWHTGGWITLRAPSDSTLTEMMRRISLDKIEIGRSTLGQALSASSIYIQTNVLNVLLNHVVSSTFPDNNPTELKKMIRAKDIPDLILGFACAIWPDGHAVSHNCTVDITKCTHVATAHVNLRSLYKYNLRRLTKKQRAMMVDRTTPWTKEMYSVYQAEQPIRSREVKLENDILVKLEMPTIQLMENASFAWLDGIVAAADEAFGQEIRGAERQEYLTDQMNVTRLRRFAHWVTQITYNDGAVVDTRDDIDQSLGVLTGNDAIREQLVKEIIKFQNDTVVAAPGYARFKCPQCGETGRESETIPGMNEFIELDVLSTFFTLTRMRVMALKEA